MLGIAAMVLLLLLAGFALPRYSQFVISTRIDAPPGTVFAQVNDPRRIRLWSTLFDDDSQFVYSGPSRGAGATTTWHSAASGSGTLTIAASQPMSRVELLMNAGEAGEARTWFELQGDQGTTEARCGFEHDYGLNVVGRYFGLLATGVIRREYEQSLTNLKDLAESLPSADFGDLTMEPVQVAAAPIAYLPTASSPDPTAVGNALSKAYFEVLRFMRQHKLQQAGAPLLIERDYRGAERRFDAAIPILGLSDETPRDSRVRIGATYSGKALKVTHVGSYERLGETHRKISAYLAATGIGRNGAAWESFVMDPAEVDEATLETEIFYPIVAD